MASAPPISTKERAFAGATVTTVNLETGEVRVELTQGYHYEVGGRQRGPTCACGCGATVQPDRKGRPRRFKRGHNNRPVTQSPRAFKEVKHSLRDCLRSLCEELEARSGDWRVRAISTPASILTDIRGRKPNPGGSVPENPDIQLLGQIGFQHLHERSG